MSFDKSSIRPSSTGRSDHLEKICLVQLSFEQDSIEGFLFCTKVRICGFPHPIDSVSTSFTKEIVFPHLTNHHGSPNSSAPTNLASLATRKCGGSANFQRQPVRFANLSFPRIDLDLARSLERFSTIVVGDQKSSDFLAYYITANAVIINIENSLTAMMGNSENDTSYRRSQQTQTDGDDTHTVRIQIDEPCERRDSVSVSPQSPPPYCEPDTSNRCLPKCSGHHQHTHTDYPTLSTNVDVCGTGRSGHHTNRSNSTNNTRQSYITTAATYLHNNAH